MPSVARASIDLELVFQVRHHPVPITTVMTGRPLAEQCIALDVAEVTGGPRVGRLTWKNAAPGFHLVYEVRPGEVILRFPNGMVQTIGLWLEEIHNGGHKTWFYLDGRRARRLWLAPDELWFRDRECLGLEYACRCMGKRGRERLREERIVKRLGFVGQTLRPTGLRSAAWRTMLGRLETIRAATGAPCR
jgi:hypothetical protein